MVMIDAQIVRGGSAGPTFHEKGGRGGRTNGAKRSIAIEILGLPPTVRVDSAKPHDLRSRRELLIRTLPQIGTLRAIAADPNWLEVAALADLLTRLRVERT